MKIADLEAMTNADRLLAVGGMDEDERASVIAHYAPTEEIARQALSEWQRFGSAVPLLIEDSAQRAADWRAFQGDVET